AAAGGRKRSAVELRARLAQIGFLVVLGLMALALVTDVLRILPRWPGDRRVRGGPGQAGGARRACLRGVLRGRGKGDEGRVEATDRRHPAGGPGSRGARGEARRSRVRDSARRAAVLETVRGRAAPRGGELPPKELPGG